MKYTEEEIEEFKIFFLSLLYFKLSFISLL